MLDARMEQTLAQVAEQVRLLFASDLICLALYGSAVGEDFIPERSNLNLVIVLRHITVTHLQSLHRLLPRWHKLGIATPLLLDRRTLERGCDVFPMEFHDIKAQHRVLYGEEVFATLCIDGQHLRYQAEHEVRGKLLRLRALYAEVGADRRRLESLLLDSVKTFLIVMRNFVRLRAGQAHTRYLGVLDQFEAHFGETFPTMRHLLRVRMQLEGWGDGIEATVGDYLQEVERLVELVDRVLPEAEAAHG
jgi:hypothetical protein